MGKISRIVHGWRNDGKHKPVIFLASMAHTGRFTQKIGSGSAMNPMQHSVIAMICFLGYVPHLVAQQPPLAERKVAAATRLDWEFAVSGFGKGAVKLPAGYDSTKQRYQLFVPKTYRKDKPAAMVLFISPGD